MHHFVRATFLAEFHLLIKLVEEMIFVTYWNLCWNF